MNVQELAALEQTWFKKQRSLTGDRKILYEQTGVYAAWQDIFGQYVALAQEGDPEALKRALFLIWAESAIAHLLTGLKDLDERRTRATLETANHWVQEGRLDAELQWMLPYYYLVEPSYLDRWENLEALKQASRHDPFLYRRRCLTVSFEHRGRMGDYWQAEQAHLRQWL